MVTLLARAAKLRQIIADALADPRARILPSAAQHGFAEQAAIIEALTAKVAQLELDIHELKGKPHGEGESG